MTPSTMSWSQVSEHVQNWYEGLLATAGIYSREQLGLNSYAADAEKAAHSVAQLALLYPAYGFTAIELRTPAPVPTVGLGRYADETHRLLEKTHEELRQFCWDYEDAYFAEFPDATNEQYEEFDSFRSEVADQLMGLENLNKVAFQVRTHAWRVEMRATIPAEYIETSGYSRAKTQGYSATRALLSLHEAGIAAEYIGALGIWERVSGHGQAMSQRVIEAYQAGISPEFFRELM